MNKGDERQLTQAKSDSWKMFNRISKKYDLLNRILSLGLDISWRKKLSAFLPSQPNVKILDLATGTADVLITLVQDKANVGEGVGVDMAEQMLEIGRNKVAQKGLQGKIQLRIADANHLPFPEYSFDCATIAFGIRNMENPITVLKEMYRVLKPNGRSLVLEFSLPQNKIIRIGHVFYLRTVVPIIGWLLSGEYKAYKYLNQTIERFPYGPAFCLLMEETGFVHVKANPLLFGAATIYQGDRS
ncbi:MAG: bifunctional demethylmenaquinone methyltransferase/2-methoxy-6-polyprenyl-1,4-benzoquinol methylase UbiE [Candidatus Omnitrophica bacterium]|nr:bifunctional demethylmenaquinone methyltransferase/2-methoxy-6-polyprenyl-1,4-benzoquinol methylase UbiE [Candidatus Omnitrophota bacterium]